MEKTFTINVPDQLWVDSWENNKTETYTYNGPETLYVLIDDVADTVLYSSTEEIEVLDGDSNFVIEIDATNDEQVAVAHYFNTLGSEHEYTYEDETNHDGSIYEKITNPIIHDYFDIDYDRGNGLTLLPIYKNTETIAEQKAKTRLEYVKKYDDAYDFDTDTQSIIDTFLSNMDTYLTTMATAYPWKYVEIDETEIPKIPASLITTFTALPELD